MYLLDLRLAVSQVKTWDTTRVLHLCVCLRLSSEAVNQLKITLPQIDLKETLKVARSAWLFGSVQCCSPRMVLWVDEAGIF